MQFVSTGLPPPLYSPPPLVEAEFPANVQLTKVGLLPELYIPPPERAELPTNVQLISVRLPVGGF
jgi:hypothetical protein